ncbi:MAG: L,D-transpeptidase [Solirubrobacterales bacterium]
MWPTFLLAVLGLFVLTAFGHSPAVAAQPGLTSAGMIKSTVKMEALGLRGGRVKILGKVTIAGSLKPFRPGQRVVVRFFNNTRQIKARAVAVRKGDGNYGIFKTGIITRRGGRHAAQVTYSGTGGANPVGPDSTTRKHWRVRFTALQPGQCGRVVRAFRRALNELAMVPSNNSCFDGKMERAVLAYRKLNDLGRSPSASRSVVKRIFNGEGAYKVRKPDLGHHMETSLSRQVLVFAKGRRPYAIFPIASGAPATPTILGTYTVYRKDPGINSLGMYYSTYFIRGYAIHGFKSVPDYPASHGCLRTFIADQPRIYGLTFIGQPIYVYGNARSLNLPDLPGYGGLDPARFDPPS